MWTKSIGIPALQVIAQSILSFPLLPYNRNRVAVETSKHLLLKTKAACGRLGVPLIVALCECEKEYGAFLNDSRFSWCSYAPAEHTARAECSLLPFDSHYNGRAHTDIAEVLIAAVQKTLRGEVAKGNAADSVKEPSCQGQQFIYPLY